MYRVVDFPKRDHGDLVSVGGIAELAASDEFSAKAGMKVRIVWMLCNCFAQQSNRNGGRRVEIEIYAPANA